MPFLDSFINRWHAAHFSPHFHPPNPLFVRLQIALVLPLVCSWMRKQEILILRSGTPLNPQQLADAALIGVAHPERVRLLPFDRFPLLDGILFQSLAEANRIMSENTIGLCLQYGIYLRNDFPVTRRLVFHELVHTHQYERMGSPKAFLRQYLYECLAFGYENSPLEKEANEVTARLCP